MIDPAQALSGFVVGAIVGLTGVGGGSLMTPLLVLLFGIIRPPLSERTSCMRRSPRPAGPMCTQKGPGRLADHGPLGVPEVCLPQPTLLSLRLLLRMLGGCCHDR